MLKFILLSILIVPGVACIYFFWVRPILAAMPALKKFYTEADGIWAKVWALCGKSATVAWSYVLAGIGMVVQLIDPVATTLGDPDLKTQITGLLQANPKVLGYFAIGVSAVTIAARLRTITKGS
jgi:hypothetical protein